MMGSGGFNSQPTRPTSPVSSQQRLQQNSLLKPEQQQQQQITSSQKMQAPQQMLRVPSTGSLGSMGLQAQSQPSMNMSMFQQQAWPGQPRPMQPPMPSPAATYQTQQQQQQQSQQQWLSQSQQSKQQQQQQQQQHHQLPMQQLSQMQPRVQLVGNQRPSTPTGSQHGSAPSNLASTGASANQMSSFDNRILGKRNIQEFTGQMDPQPRLDAEGEDVSVEKSDDFSETVRQKQAHLLSTGPSGNSMQGLQSMGLMGSGGLGSQLIRPLAPISSQQQRMELTTLRPPQQQQPIASPQKMQTTQQMSRGLSAGSLGSQFQSMSPSSQPFTNTNTSNQQWHSNQAKQAQSTSTAYHSQYQQQAQQRQQQQVQQPQQRQQLQQQQHLKPQHQQSTQLPQMQHRAQLIGNQRPPAPSGTEHVVSGPLSSLPVGEQTKQVSSPNRNILGKRSIQELVAQVDPHQRLDPEVEDILVEIADDFIETVTASACALAKHRKSSTLEVKDVLLHLERNWHIVVPGFGNDEYCCYKKPVISEAHKSRIQLVKKSLSMPHFSNEAGAAKNIAVPATNGNKSLQHHSSSAPLPTSLSSPGLSHTSR